MSAGPGVEDTKRCGICAGEAVLKARGLRGFQEPAVFDVFECATCSARFCDPMEFADDIYDRIYAEPASLRGYDRYLTYRSQIKRQKSPLGYLADSEDIYWGIQRLLPGVSAASSPIRILDVGCGLGYLTFALRSAGYKAVGIDISDAAIANARDHFGGDFRTATLPELAASGERFQAVIMAELIEHVVDPTALIWEGLGVLTDDGQLIVTTPNRSAYAPDAVWSGDLPPVHLWWLSEDSLRIIAGSVGCEIEFLDYTKFNETHLAAMSAGWCSPQVGAPGLDARGLPKHAPVQHRAAEMGVRAAVRAVHALGLTHFVRKIRTYARHGSSTRWATGPRRMSMAASLTRRRKTTGWASPDEPAAATRP